MCGVCVCVIMCECIGEDIKDWFLSSICLSVCLYFLCLSVLSYKLVQDGVDRNIVCVTGGEILSSEGQ